MSANRRIPTWSLSLLCIFALSVIGIGISIFAGIFIPFWILLGFSLIYSIEKWFPSETIKYRTLGKLYRLVLNLSILALLAATVWSGIKLFSQQFIGSPLTGSLVFLGEAISLVWIWTVVSKNSWRWPNMKLTVLSVIALFLVLAFAGVKPFDGYKEKALSFVRSSLQASPALERSTSTQAPKSTPNPVPIRQMEPYVVYRGIVGGSYVKNLTTIGRWTGSTSKTFEFNIDKSPAVINFGCTPTSQIRTNLDISMQGPPSSYYPRVGNDIWQVVMTNGEVLEGIGKYAFKVTASGCNWSVKIGRE